jgi:hypothetical protein
MHNATHPHSPSHHHHMSAETEIVQIMATLGDLNSCQELGASSTLKGRLHFQDEKPETPGLSTKDESVPKDILLSNGASLANQPAQPPGLPSSESLPTVATSAFSTTSHSLQHHAHSSALYKSNDSALSSAPQHSHHPSHTDIDQRRIFPSLPVPIEGSSEGTLPHANSTTPATFTCPSSFAQLNRADSASISGSGEAALTINCVDRTSLAKSQHDRLGPALETSPASPSVENETKSSGVSSSPGAASHHSPMSKRDSLPLGLRNKKMQATDCLLFAATLLEGVGTAAAHMMVNSADATETESGDVSACANEGTAPSSKMAKEPVASACPIAPGSHWLLLPASASSSSAERNESVPFGFSQDVASSSPISIVAGALSVASDADVGATSSGSCISPPLMDTSTVTEPKIVDVLCGRGGKVNNHPGNVIFRRVVAFNKAYYQSVHKRNRILVSQSIVQAIINHGGRFLIMGPKGKKCWIPIDFKKAVQKTSQALREFKKEDEDSGIEDKAVAASQLEFAASHELIKS